MSDVIKETNDEYHARDELSNSMLQVLRNCPQEFHGRFVTKTMPKPEQTKAMALGHIVHCVVLEPMEFRNRFVIPPAFHLDPENVTKAGKKSTAKTTTYYEEKIAWFEETANAAKLEIVTLADIETASACAKALLMHDQLAGLWSLENAVVETPIFFTVEGSPFRCKPDLVVPDQSLIIDVKKTARDASPQGFAKSVVEYGYHRQAALYLDAAAHKYGKEFRFLFAVVCEQSPHEVACYELSEEAIRAGEDEAISLVLEYQTRIRTNNWLPAWSSGVVEISLPRWHKSNVYELDEVTE